MRNSQHYSSFREQEKAKIVKLYNFQVQIAGKKIFGRESFEVQARTLDQATEIATRTVFNCSTVYVKLTLDKNISKVSKGQYYFEVLKTTDKPIDVVI